MTTPTPHIKARRLLLISAFRAKWAIRQTQARQLQAAIEVLVDEKMDDEMAVKVANDIANVNIGP